MKILLSIALLFAAIISRAQKKETFDLATFEMPSGWTKTKETTDVMSYAITDNKKGTFCQIGIYASTISKGSLELDFESEWQELIVKSYKPTQNPEMVPSASVNEWDAKGGVAPFAFNGGTSIAMLVTMSGHQRCMSIVIVTNTDAWQNQAEKFLASVDMSKPKVNSVSLNNNTKPNNTSASINSSSGKYAFSTTNFDDGWTSTIKEDWVEVVKGDVIVLIHFRNEKVDTYNPDIMGSLNNAWNYLVAPKYSSTTDVNFRPVIGWESLDFADADGVESTTGRSVYIVLFKKGYSNGSGKYMEVITPNKATFENEFGAFQGQSSWDKLEKMVGYNKFAVAASDLTGKWTNDFSGALSYVNAYTGASAGMSTHASNEAFEFGPGNKYKWDLGVASGFVGNIKFQSANSSGTLSVPNNWQVTFSDIEGKPRTYNAYFACVKGARVLWFDDSGFGKID